MSQIQDIVIVGLGGQGNLFLAKTLCKAVIAAGHNVLMSEIHGQAQRGGTVVTNVRIGETISPMVPNERPTGWSPPSCTRRCASTARPRRTRRRGRDLHRLSVERVLGLRRHLPSRAEVENEIRRLYHRVLFVDPDAVARDCGHPQAANVALLGALMAVGGLPVDDEQVLKTLKASVSMWTWMVDKKAFRAGFELARKRLEAA